MDPSHTTNIILLIWIVPTLDEGVLDTDVDTDEGVDVSNDHVLEGSL